MKLQEVLDRTIHFFKEKDLDTPRLDAELLIAKALNFRRIDLYLKFDQPLGDPELIRCREFVKRRAGGEPVAYIVGEKDFFGLSFFVDSRVLIPRPETEILAEAAFEFLKHESLSEPHILDLGSGSGCLGLTLAAKVPGARVSLVDISKDALSVGKINAERLGVNERCTWIGVSAESLDFPAKTFDLIVANPPYIARGDVRLQEEVGRFEPNLALFSEDQGLHALKTWSTRARRLLKEKAWMGFEFGIDQSEAVLAHFKSLDLENVHILKDFASIPRHIIGEKGFSNG